MTKVLTCIFFLLLYVSASAQVPTGLILEDEEYDTLSISPPSGKKDYEKNLPSKYSLRQYCPTPGDQGITASCVAWATAYGALTIMRAVRAVQRGKKIDAAAVTAIAHSPHYVFNQVKEGEDCLSGSKISKNLNLLKDQGACLFSTFSPNTCLILPEEKEKKEAESFRIKRSFKVFNDKTTSDDQKIKAIKEKLVKNIPVIIGLSVTQSFDKIKQGQKTWDPKNEPLKKDAHTMVIIGYDDKKQAFEVMNSHGTKWGDKGFIWLTYEGFKNVVTSNVCLDLGDGEKNEGGADGVSVCKELRRIVPAGDSIEYKPETTKFNADGIFYEQVSNEGWRRGDYYELSIEGIPPGLFLYVFSLDATGRIRLHFPEEGQNGKISYDDTQVLIPGRDRGALRLGPPGREYLCTLISNFQIKDILTRLDAVQQKAGDFAARLRAGFPELIPRDQVAYSVEDEKMCVESTLKAELPSIVPLILVFDVQR